MTAPSLARVTAVIGDLPPVATCVRVLRRANGTFDWDGATARWPRLSRADADALIALSDGSGSVPVRFVAPLHVFTGRAYLDVMITAERDKPNRLDMEIIPAGPLRVRRKAREA